MIKYFVKFSFACNFQDEQVIWSQKNLLKTVNWSKYNTVSPEKKYYFLDNIKWLVMSATWKHFNINSIIGPLGTQWLILATNVTQKMLESPDSMCS